MSEFNGDDKLFDKLVKEREVVPPFMQFRKEPGFFKLITDRRFMDSDGGFLPQRVVEPTFNMEAVNKILKDYSGQESDKVAKPHAATVEKFMKGVPKFSKSTGVGRSGSRDSGFWYSFQKDYSHKMKHIKTVPLRGEGVRLLNKDNEVAEIKGFKKLLGITNDKNIVYRTHDPAETGEPLNGRNAGDIRGIINFLHNSFDEPWKADSIVGDSISAFKVELGKPEDYHLMQGGESVRVEQMRYLPSEVVTSLDKFYRKEIKTLKARSKLTFDEKRFLGRYENQLKGLRDKHELFTDTGRYKEDYAKSKNFPVVTDRQLLNKIDEDYLKYSFGIEQIIGSIVEPKDRILTQLPGEDSFENHANRMEPYRDRVKDGLIKIPEIRERIIADIRWPESKIDPKIKFSKSVTSPEFKTWSRGYDILKGAAISAAKAGKGIVVKVYHGTTNIIEMFDPTVKGTKEGYFGQVNYFTSSKLDAEQHYKGKGPDLERRIEDLSERLSNMDEEQAVEWAHDHNFDPDEVLAAKDNINALEQIADDYLTGPVEETMEMYVRLDNPVVIGSKRDQNWIDVYDIDEDQIRQDAIEEGLTEDELEERIYEERDGADNKILDALTEAIRETIGYEQGAPDGIAQDIMSQMEIYDMEISATELHEQLIAAEALAYMDDENGNLVANHVAARVFKHLGYDGIILANADKTFPGMKMEPGTSHIHVFKETPSQMKAAVSEFTEDPRIKFSKAPTNILTRAFKRWFGKSKVVNKDGSPKVVYHGSRNAMPNILEPIYFTESAGEANAYSGKQKSDMLKDTIPGDGVTSVYLSIKNPKILKQHDAYFLRAHSGSKSRIEELKAQGFDGIVMPWEGEGWGESPKIKNFIPFEPTQIKSIFNNGEFSSTNPDIRFSKSKILDQADQPITEQDYATVLTDTKSTKMKVAAAVAEVRSDIRQQADKFFGAISTRLANIKPELRSQLRKMEFGTGTAGYRLAKAVEPLLKKTKKMSRGDSSAWDYARKNSDIPKIRELIKKYALEKEYTAYRAVLDKIRADAIAVGLDVGEIEEYAPRILKDAQGYLEATEQGKDWPVIQKALNAKAASIGLRVDELTLDQRADLISNMLVGGATGLGGIAATKERKLTKIPAELNKFYMNSDAALLHHIYSMTEAIEARKFFGKIPAKVAKIKTRLAKLNEQIVKLRKNPDPNAEQIDAYDDVAREYYKLINVYADQRDFSANIGAYVDELLINKEIDGSQQQDLIEILKARFHQKGMHGSMQAYKNLSYIDTMGSITSAITQIGDLAWSFYENGMIRTLKHMGKAAIKRSGITKQDVGVERIAQEFADGGMLGNAVTKVFKMTGLEYMDAIGKETLLNASLERYQAEARKNPGKLKAEIQKILEGETDSTIQELVSGEITDNVKLLVYSRLLDFQPVALSEMPQKYLEAGNGRLFYMLKSFTLKQFDIYRREIYHNLASPDKATKLEGMKNLVMLSAFFVIANAGADEIKDWLLGRETDFEDRVVDNMLRLFGISKFVTWKARTEGIGSAALKQLIFPVKFLDSLYKDVYNMGDDKGLETLASVPLVGKLAYWHMGRGTSKREDLWTIRFRKEKQRLNKINDRYEKSKDKTAFRAQYSKDLMDLRRINAVQGRLNTNRKLINRYKAKESTPVYKQKIKELEDRRIVIMEEYLNKEK